MSNYYNKLAVPDYKQAKDWLQSTPPPPILGPDSYPKLRGATTFVDLFSGIGGFHIAFKNLGCKCVLACEIDPHARESYLANFGAENPDFYKNAFPNDVTKLNAKDIPDFDVLCAGFPCQPFSQAGFKRGFKDTERGNLFFEIARIIDEKRPKALFLENVRHLVRHDDGRTFKIIQKTLADLEYYVTYKVVRASDHGLPQHRARVFIIGFDIKQMKTTPPFQFPSPEPLRQTMSDIFEGKCSRKIGYTLRVGGRGSPLNDRRNWDRYLVGGIEKQLGPKEGLKMMGFPNTHKLSLSTTQAMKQLGNAVAVNAVQATAKNMLAYLLTNGEEK